MFKYTPLVAGVGVLMVLIVASIVIRSHLRNERSAQLLAMQPLPQAAIVDGALVGRYYQGDGTGVNLHLNLRIDGTFSCQWTGCLGDYGGTKGSWGRVGNTVYVSPTNATQMFLRSPLENMKVVVRNKESYLLPVDWIDFVEEHGQESLPMAAFSRTD